MVGGGLSCHQSGTNVQISNNKMYLSKSAFFLRIIQETTKSSPSSEYDDCDDHSMDTILLSVNGNYVQCQRGKVGVQLSVNNIDGLLLTSSLEQFNTYIGNDNLFKRSFILIKMWIYNESRRFSYLGKFFFVPYRYSNNYLLLLNQYCRPLRAISTRFIGGGDDDDFCSFDDRNR